MVNDLVVGNTYRFRGSPGRNLTFDPTVKGQYIHGAGSFNCNRGELVRIVMGPVKYSSSHYWKASTEDQVFFWILPSDIE